MMSEKYITITGIRHYYGRSAFEIGDKVRCVKDRENVYDKEAIKVMLPKFGQVGNVANSVNTVKAGTMSAGRIYDKVDESFRAKVLFIDDYAVIAEVLEKKNKKKK